MCVGWLQIHRTMDIFHISIDVDFIYKQINGLKCKSNVDILGIDSKLIKLGASALAPSLTHIFNESITSGNIPDDWKCAKVTPIFKGMGSPEQCCNYRPISVTSHVSKLMEKAVLYQLNEYVLSHDFITCHQSAFRKIIPRLRLFTKLYVIS